MSLYHHVENMGDVLDIVVDALFAETRAPAAREPRQALAELAAAYIAMAERHPNAFVLVATRRWRTPRALHVAEMAVALFRQIGASSREALRKARILGAYMNGAGLALAAWRSGGAPSAVSAVPPGALNAEAVRADLDAGLKRLLAQLWG
jgi:AcrR family transcriptional regulator